MSRIDSHLMEAFFENVLWLRQQGMCDDEIARRLETPWVTFEKRLRVRGIEVQRWGE